MNLFFNSNLTQFKSTNSLIQLDNSNQIIQEKCDNFLKTISIILSVLKKIVIIRFHICVWTFFSSYKLDVLYLILVDFLIVFYWNRWKRSKWSTSKQMCLCYIIVSMINIRCPLFSWFKFTFVFILITKNLWLWNVSSHTSSLVVHLSFLHTIFIDHFLPWHIVVVDWNELYLLVYHHVLDFHFKIIHVSLLDAKCFKS